MQDVVAILRQIDQVVQQLRPMAAVFGVTKIFAYTNAAIGLASHVLARLEETQEVISSTDELFVRELLTRLQQENDRLNKMIEES